MKNRLFDILIFILYTRDIRSKSKDLYIVYKDDMIQIYVDSGSTISIDSVDGGDTSTIPVRSIETFIPEKEWFEETLRSKTKL